jgi:hypothetical protein
MRRIIVSPLEVAKRDPSTSWADSFAGANEKKKRRPAPVGMTVQRGYFF